MKRGERASKRKRYCFIKGGPRKMVSQREIKEKERD
jgi:hypothetical protein